MNRSSSVELLSIRGLTHRYGQRTALRDVAIDVASGEIVGLMGPNGSGKSTAFSLLTGLLPLRQGRIELDGRETSPKSWTFRRDIGVVFQHVSLDARLSARENLMLTARMHGLPGPQSRAVTDLGIQQAGLQGRAEDIVGTLSGGMRRRLDLARAMLHNPRFLFMDEPTTGLDLESFEMTWRLLEELKATGRVGILLTTHRAEEAERCDKLIVLREGECVRTATPADLLAEGGADKLILETPHPDLMAERIKSKLKLDALVLAAGTVTLEVKSAQEWVGPIATLFDHEMLRGITLKRPGLAEAYFKVTGSSLAGAQSEATL